MDARDNTDASREIRTKRRRETFTAACIGKKVGGNINSNWLLRLDRKEGRREMNVCLKPTRCKRACDDNNFGVPPVVLKRVENVCSFSV